MDLYLLDSDVISLWVQTITHYSKLPRLQYLQLVNRFLQWCVSAEYLLTNPFPLELLDHKKLHYPLRVCPSVGDVDAISKDAKCSVKHELRNQAILDLIYGCGLRRMEVIALNINDVGGRYLVIKGKKAKERMVPLPGFVQKSLKAYLVGERLCCETKLYENALFVSALGTRLGAGAVHDIFRRQLRSAFSAHQFRHAFATHMLQNGCNVRILQRFLGHERLSTTAIYTQVELDDLAGMLRECPPLG